MNVKNVRRLAGTLSVTSALLMATGAVAGATTGVSTQNPPPAAVNCTRAPQSLARIAKAETKLQKLTSLIDGWESQAQAGGFTKIDSHLEKFATKAQNREKRLSATQQRITAACPGARS